MEAACHWRDWGWAGWAWHQGSGEAVVRLPKRDGAASELCGRLTSGSAAWGAAGCSSGPGSGSSMWAGQRPKCAALGSGGNETYGDKASGYGVDAAQEELSNGQACPSRTAHFRCCLPCCHEAMAARGPERPPCAVCVAAAAFRHGLHRPGEGRCRYLIALRLLTQYRSGGAGGCLATSADMARPGAGFQGLRGALGCA